MSKTLTIEVTEADVKYGRRKDAEYCALARATKRAMFPLFADSSEWSRVFVDEECVDTPVGYFWHSHRSAAFLRQFDAGRTFGERQFPIRFRLEKIEG